MPLHDWTELEDWQTVHTYWITELGHWLRPRLPSGYRVSLGTIPALVVGAGPAHPDVSVRRPAGGGTEVPQPGQAVAAPDLGTELAPDEEVVAAILDPPRAVYVTRAGNPVAVIELVSPRNKDRPESRHTTTDRYLGYLTHGVHLLFVDVHRHPLAFSFADDLTEALRLSWPGCPAPCAVSYRVGDPAPEGGHFLARWRRSLTIGAPLPTLPLYFRRDSYVLIDLEQTYVRAAAAAYL
jgi:hypothetical protein